MVSDPKKISVIVLLSLMIPVISALVYFSGRNRPVTGDTPVIRPYYEPYLVLMDKVYDEMDRSYYKPVSREVYDRFRRFYVNKYLSRLREPSDGRSGVDKRLAYLGAGLLVEKLRAPDDTFTSFIPPAKAREYAEEVYSYGDDVGIEGHKVDEVFLLDNVHVRSDSYTKGLRKGDIVLAVNDIPVKVLDEEKIKELLSPPEGGEVKITVAIVDKKEVVEYIVVSGRYFKDTVYELPTGMSGVYMLKISSFNKETANDIKKFISGKDPSEIEYLILDIRDNPGGPPLSIREISGIFLPPEEKLFYYRKKDTPEFGLTSPGSDVTYKDTLIVLINGGSGSSSELLAGTLKAHNRATVMGKNPTAGFAFLKGAVNFDDGSMLVMITGEAFLFDGTPLDSGGISPSYPIPEDVDDIRKFVLDQIRIRELMEKNLESAGGKNVS